MVLGRLPDSPTESNDGPVVQVAFQNNAGSRGVDQGPFASRPLCDNRLNQSGGPHFGHFHGSLLGMRGYLPIKRCANRPTITSLAIMGANLRTALSVHLRPGRTPTLTRGLTTGQLLTTRTRGVVVLKGAAAIHVMRHFRGHPRICHHFHIDDRACVLEHCRLLALLVTEIIIP